MGPWAPKSWAIDLAFRPSWARKSLVPSNLGPTHEVVVKFNWVVLWWSCWDIYKIPSATLNGSPPCFFEIYKRYVSFSSVFNRVGCGDQTIFGCKAHHNGELGLNVTLPPNVSLDLGLEMACDTWLSKDRYTQTGSHVIQWSQGPTTLGHETMVASWVQVEKGIEPLDLAE